MKKTLLLLLAALPLLFGLSSCSDEKDLPDVDFNIVTEGASYLDGTLYVVQGETLEIQSITVTNNEPNKAAAITNAAYYWDGYYLGTNPVAPFKFEIETDEDTPLGEHLLLINTTVVAVGKEVATAVIGYDVQVVATPDDIPADAVSSFTTTPTYPDK